MPSPSNPIAGIQENLFSNNQFKKEVKSCFCGANIPNMARICEDAKVTINGCNFKPRWGLYNDAIGTVKGISYQKGKGLYHGYLPEFVGVHFPQ
jgi:hypothetical protein